MSNTRKKNPRFRSRFWAAILARAAGDGQFVLKNRDGQVIRAFTWDAPALSLIYREDTRRVEAHADLAELDAAKVRYQILSKVTKSQIQKKSLAVGDIATLEFIHSSSKDEELFPHDHELAQEKSEEKFKTIFFRSAMAQVALIAAVIGLGTYLAPVKAPEAQSDHYPASGR